MTSRDVLIFQFLCRHKAASADVLASLFFRANPNHGGANKNPEEAARRWIYEMQRAGLLMTRAIGTRSGVTHLVQPTASAAKRIGTRKPRALHPRGVVHHVETLRALLPLLVDDPAGDGVLLEHHLRRNTQRGKTKKGEKLPTYLDAVAFDNATGETVGLEYVTSKYSDALILEKVDALKAFDRPMFVADTARTQARVTRLTGLPCVLAGGSP